MKKRISIESFLKYCMVASVILTGVTMYGVLEKINEQGIKQFSFTITSLVATTILILWKIIKYRPRSRPFKICFFVLLYFAVYLIATRHAVTTAIGNMCIPVLLFVLLACFEKPEKIFVDFFNRYENIVYFLACMSLVFYVGGVLLHIIPHVDERFTNNGLTNRCENYLNLHFVNEWQKTTIRGITIYRNIGIFMEGPGFAGTLLWAFWWELFGHSQYSRKRIIIFLITLATTFSTKAYAFSVIIYFLFAYSKASDKAKFWKKVRNVFLPIMLIVATAIVVYVMWKKITESSSMGATSWEVRVADYYAAFKAWLTRPVFGVGFYNLEELYVYLPVGMMKGDPTAGIINILAYGGLYMFVGNMIGIGRYYISLRNTENKETMRSFIVLLFLLLFTSSMQYSFIYYFILAVGITLPSKRVSLVNYDRGNNHRKHRRRPAMKSQGGSG